MYKGRFAHVFFSARKMKKKKASLFVSRSCARIRFSPRLGDRARLLKIQEHINFDASVSQSKAFITIYFLFSFFIVLLFFVVFVTQVLTNSAENRNRKQTGNDLVVETKANKIQAIFIPSFKQSPSFLSLLCTREKKVKEHNNM